MSSAESEEFGKVKEVLNHFRGNNPVFIVCRNTNRRLAAPKSMFVSENGGLISALKEILGEENVKFVKWFKLAVEIWRNMVYTIRCLKIFDFTNRKLFVRMKHNKHAACDFILSHTVVNVFRESGQKFALSG